MHIDVNYKETIAERPEGKQGIIWRILKLYVMRLYIVIPKATKITVIQKDTAKKLMDKLKWNTETI